MCMCVCDEKMTTVEEKRLFVGGLAKGVMEAELLEKFSRFGHVSKVEIKTRTTDTDSKTFAYLNLTAEENGFKKCFTAFNNAKWKGGQLKIQFAKESFLSKLKKEQAEVAKSQEKKESQPSPLPRNPALESDKKAVPGTPMDDKGTWVMGKYSRVLPVLHVRKPGTGKMVTLDPSKMTHCLKKLKSDDFDSAKHGDLTWHLEENTSDINKKRQGQFPVLGAPRYHSTHKELSAVNQKSIFSRLQGLAAEEYVSETEMEVVPVGKSGTVAQGTSDYNSDDSASSADTDEIVCKASSKKTSKATTTCSAASKSSREKKNQEKSLATRDHSVEDLAGPSPLETSSKKPSGKKMPLALHTKQSDVQSIESDMKAASMEKLRPQFQFVKTPTIKGRVLKKSVKLSQNKKSSEESSAEKCEENEDTDMHVPKISGNRKPTKKTPEFKGLGMLSSDSEDTLPTTHSTKLKSSKTPITSSESATSVSVIHANNVNSSLQQKRPHSDADSDSEDTEDILSTTKRKTAEKKQNTVSEQELEICGKKKRKLFQKKQQKEVVHPSESSRDAKSGANSPMSSESVRQVAGDDLDEYASGLPTDPSVPFPQKKQKSEPVSSDDSDLDDNDFEKVGKKLAARALKQQQRGQGSPGKRQAASAISAASISDSRKRKASQVDEGHLTSMQKSHQAYNQAQKEKKKKENLITKTLREGTGSTHVQFSDSEEEDKSQKMKPAPMSWFTDESDSGSEQDFALRPQFEGSKGRKLFELQMKIRDERFRLDERFADDTEEGEKMVEQESEDEMEVEQRQNMGILEKVLGYKPRQRTRMVYEDMSKRRYIPGETAHLDLSSGVESKKRKKNGHAETPHLDLSSGIKSKDSLQESLEIPSPESSEHKSPEPSEDSESAESSNHSPSSPDPCDSHQQVCPVEESAEDDHPDKGRVKSLKGLFQGGASFTFFGPPDVEDVPVSEPVRFSQKAMEEEEKDEEEDEEEDEEKDEEKDEEEDEEEDHEEEDHEEDEEMSVLSKSSRIMETERARPPVQQQPSFMVSRDDPRLTAAVRFFKRPHQDDFEELSERWPDERQKIMQLVREKHKRACRKERKMKQGVKSRTFAKTRK